MGVEVVVVEGEEEEEEEVQRRAAVVLITPYLLSLRLSPERLIWSVSSRESIARVLLLTLLMACILASINGLNVVSCYKSLHLHLLHACILMLIRYMGRGSYNEVRQHILGK